MKLALLLILTAVTPAPVHLTEPVQDKNFYLLSLIESTPGARQAVAADPVLSSLHPESQFADPQTTAAAHALAALYKNSPAVRARDMRFQFVSRPLRVEPQSACIQRTAVERSSHLNK